MRTVCSATQRCCASAFTPTAATLTKRNDARRLLDDHMRSCVVDAVNDSGADADDTIAEVSEAISRLIRS